MPIVTVEIVTASDREWGRDITQSLADAIGRALNSAPGHTWVRCRLLGQHEYAENEGSSSDARMPVFVTITRRQLPAAHEIEAEVEAVTVAVAEVVGRRPDQVHVEYAPAAAGRLAFGGKVVR